MWNTRTPFFAIVIAAGLLGSVAAEPARARSQTPPEEYTRHVDLVIALDVSGSMSGLIASAKQRLWDVVNELGRAQPQPELRVAILSYGNPGYGAESGYVRIDQPFTSDLDAVNETLFGFGTNGGDEYVARAVSTSVRKLHWSPNPDALKIVFVAGNEAADQDPQVSVRGATAVAAGKGIVVNTIYCGPDNDAVAAGWREVATLTNGLYASIDQNASAVANVATPMDGELLELNRELNDTYIAYGRDGDRYRANQLEQDANAGAMSSSAMASRAVTKAGRLYDSSHWDLVDAVEEGAAVDEFEAEELPEAMQAMSIEERKAYVEEQAAKREALRARIATLDEERRDFIAAAREEEAQTNGLDEVLQEGIRSLAEAKGFTFD